MVEFAGVRRKDGVLWKRLRDDTGIGFVFLQLVRGGEIHRGL